MLGTRVVTIVYFAGKLDRVDDLYGALGVASVFLAWLFISPGSGSSGPGSMLRPISLRRAMRQRLLMGEAFAWGLLAGSSLVIGALIVFVHKPSNEPWA